MKLHFCGGAGEIGASCVMINLSGKNLVFDVGARMGQTKDVLPDFRTIQENGGVDAIFISHAHMDHIGSLPVLSSAYPNAKIYMTHPTKDLVKVLLQDSLKIMDGREEEIPMYAEVHVKNALDRCVCLSNGFTLYPFSGDTEDEIAVTFYSAGHIAGASAIYVKSKDGAVLYSGDFSVTKQRTVDGVRIPKLNPDVAIFEATYGDRLHSSRSIEEDRLIEKVREIVSAGKKILIPAFALGRAQEAILILKKALSKGLIPACKIYVDGMVRDVCRVYQQNPNYLNSQLARKIFKEGEIFYDDNVIAVSGKPGSRDELISRNEPCVIISSSGMLTGGPSLHYATKLCQDEGNFIAITGYQDEEAPGRKLLDLLEAEKDTDKVLKIGDVTIPVRCGIGKYGLSAHADKSEIIALVHSLKAKDVFLCHGNPGVLESLAKDIQLEYRGRVYYPNNGEAFEVNLKKPRAQWTKEKIPNLGRINSPEEKDIEILWDFVFKNFQKPKGYTVQELLYCWTGGNDFDEESCKNFRILLNNSKHFDIDKKMPFIYLAKTKEELKNPAKSNLSLKDGLMEVNKMLDTVAEYFTPETGLYKKGAMPDSKVALLSFTFPEMATKLKEQIKEFEAATGWKVKLNEVCNTATANSYIENLFGDKRSTISKISYMSLQNAFKVKLDANISDEADIKRNFKELSGMDLIIERSGTNNIGIIKADANQMEQNAALAHIELAFRDQADKLCKKSLKQYNNQPCIELTFASAAVGERYGGLIDTLEEQIRWKITINPTPNQHEIFTIGNRIFADNNIALKKNFSFDVKELTVMASLLDNNYDNSILEKIKTDFVHKTGVNIIFK